MIYDPETMAVPPALHELEADVMDEMWRLERGTVRDVMEALNTRASKPRALECPP